MTSRRALLAVPLLLICAPYLAGIGLLLPMSLRGTDGWSLAGYAEIFGRVDYLAAVLNTLWVSMLVALCSMPIGLAGGVFIARSQRNRGLLMALILVPWMVSVVVRSYGWTILLSNRGALNATLAMLDLPPLRLMFEVPGVVIGLVHVLSPFVVLSVMAAALHQDPALDEAASSLGARPLRTFLQVTLPLVAPALLTGTALVFLLACGAVVTPLLLGGVRARMIGQQIYQDIFELFDIVKASALAVVLLGLTVIIAVLVYGVREFATRRGGQRLQAEPGR